MSTPHKVNLDDIGGAVHRDVQTGSPGQVDRRLGGQGRVEMEDHGEQDGGWDVASGSWGKGKQLGSGKRQLHINALDAKLMAQAVCGND